MLASRFVVRNVARRRLFSRLLKFPKRSVAIPAASTPTPETAHKLKVTLIPGDGVGPELIYAVEDIVENTGIPLVFEEIFLSEIHYTRSQSIEEAVSSIAKNNNVALKGVIQESGLGSVKSELQGMNMRLKRELDLFANVVHIRTFAGIKTRHNQKLDFIIVREQTEGEYSSLEHELVPGVIECLKIMTRKKCDRIAKFAFDYATKHGRHKVTAVHKANIMKLGDGLFLRSCREMSQLYPRIEFESMIVDNCCMQLVSRPEQFDVLVMPNLYGNIVDNLAAGLVGGAGVVTGQSVGSDSVIFEPGSSHAYQQAFGRQIANPTAMILCCANMLNHLHLKEYGNALRQAVEKVIADGKVRTRDLGGYASTSEFTSAVIDNFKM
uniref:Isocitrate dehydrogenase [NAD] subunit, mitochondrial n=1 Tax=Parascaris univalens TaxID=6257 RepID=A0A915AZ99_PARUN